MPIDLTPTCDPARGEALFRQAEEAETRGERTEALRLLGEARRANPYDDEVPLLAALLAFRSGAWEGAVLSALEALKVRPYNPPALNLLGVSCTEVGDGRLGGRVLKELRRLAPKLANTRRNLKDAKRRSGRAAPSSARWKELRAEVEAVVRSDRTGLTVAVLWSDPGTSVADCLAPWSELASEILVLDAGGGAGGRFETELPDRAGFLKLSTPGDRAYAWNQGVSLASQPWVLLLEAEDRPGPGAVEEVAARLDRTGEIAHATRIVESDGAERGSFRLVRNAPVLCFRGARSPSPIASLRSIVSEWGCRLGETGIVLRTSGTAGVSDDRASTGFGDSDDPWAAASRALQQARSGHAEGAIDTVHAASAAVPQEALLPPEREALRTAEGLALLHLGRVAEAEAVLEELRSIAGDTANLAFLEACAAHGRGNPVRALERFRDALRDDAPSAGWLGRLREITGAGLPNLLGATALDLGELDVAEQAFELALERDPDGLEARLGKLGLGTARQAHEAVLQELDRLVAGHGDRLQVWEAGAMALAGLPGMAEPLVTWLQEAERRFPGDPAIARRLGDAHLCRGDGERALRLWNGTDAETDLARTVAACLVSGRELPEVPHDQEDGVADGVLEWCGRWASESAWETLDAALSRIPQVASDLPVLRDRTVAWLDRAGQTEAADRLRKGPPAVP